ncbi:Uncharacterized protein F35H12.5 [Toxocara canis]|uniref:Uncharacterized protein F35H12.5 n=1 Tax=Toxocara canis TaxID=6265 RepID=A0A0B2UR86_TOXCA|nr:Uncharacterized protein F35H12.5 [Toxocara canis]
MGCHVAICLATTPRILCFGKLRSRDTFFLTRTQYYGNDKQQVSGQNDLRTERIKIRSHDGEILELDAVIQDTIPSVQSVASVIACHGAPGSHNDFKHFLPFLKDRTIRFIGINFPGFGFTSPDSRLRHENRERLDFVKEIVERLKLNENLIFVGHSRGSVTALKLGAIFKDRTTAVVLVNPMGLINHRAIRPFWKLRDYRSLEFFLAYKYLLKIRAETGEIAATCVRTIRSVDLASQKDYIRILNDSNVFIVHAGRDWFIEPEISEHFANSFSGIKKLTCRAGPEEEHLASVEVKRLIDEGERRIAVYFSHDGHFLQKHRAKFLVDAVYWMLEDERTRHMRTKGRL